MAGAAFLQVPGDDKVGGTGSGRIDRSQGDAGRMERHCRHLDRSGLLTHPSGAFRQIRPSHYHSGSSLHRSSHGPGKAWGPGVKSQFRYRPHYNLRHRRGWMCKARKYGPNQSRILHPPDHGADQDSFHPYACGFRLPRGPRTQTRGTSGGAGQLPARR